MSECIKWWGGSFFNKGYGRVRGDFGVYIGAHRMVYEECFGPIAEGLCVLHRCDNPPCVNPEHLFLGTKADNNADRSAKGRTFRAHGENHPSSKIKDADIKDMREMRAAGMLLREIGQKFGITPQRVHQLTR